MVVLAHHRVIAQEVLHRQAFQRVSDLRHIERAGLVDTGLDHLEDGPETCRIEIKLVGVAERLGPGFGLGILDVDRMVLGERHDRIDLAVARWPDRGRPAGQVGIEGVVTQIGPGLNASLDQQVHVRAPVARQQGLRTRGLDLGDVGREVLDLAQRDQLVADHFDVRPVLGQEDLDVALHRLAEQIVLVQQVDLVDALGQ